MSNAYNPILVLDDDELIRNVVQHSLGRAGYDVILCATAQEALQIIEAQSLSLIITDISMPEMDGESFVKLIREQGHDIPVLAISGDAGFDSQLMNATLQKPFRKDVLLTTVAELLG